MWLILVPIGIMLCVLAIGALWALATRPASTITALLRFVVNLVRVVLFVFAVAFGVAYFLTDGEPRQDALVPFLTLLGLWLLTFVAPAAVRRVVRSRPNRAS